MIAKTLVGYADRLSVAPGETLRFMVSCYVPGSYRADIVRLICGDESERGAGFKEEELETAVSGEYPGREQPVHPGSYAIVPEVPALESFSAQVLIWPTLPQLGRQAIMGTWNEAQASGFALGVDEHGEVELVLGSADGSVSRLGSGLTLQARRWVRVSASYDASTGSASLTQSPLGLSVAEEALSRSAEVSAHFPPGIRSPAAPLLFAARAGAPVGGHFNGKIEAPRLAKRALPASELYALLDQPDAVVACWDFSVGIPTESISDLSTNALHGQTVNLPTRAVTGSGWTGSEQSWRHAPSEYAAIHFHDDDLCDAGWEADFELRVPRSFRSGVYAARLRLGEGDDYVTFFVRPARGSATAKVAYLAPTASYLAYANNRLSVAMLGGATVRNPNEAMLLAHPEFGPSLYERHSDGSGVHYSSHLRPIVNMKAKALLWGFNADSNITDWLEHTGHAYDVITDEDLHNEGRDLLAPYRVVITGSHPEYYSTVMLDELSAHLGEGGRLMYMGGNGFYWRIAFHPTRPGVIEVRRAEDGTRTWIAEPGEYYHSFNGEYGGLWRRLKRPPNRLVGIGFAAQGFDRSSHYRRLPGSHDPRAAFAFEGISEKEIIGDYGRIGDGAAGQEIDRCDFALDSPRHTLVLATSEGHTPAMLRTKEEFFATTTWFEDKKVRADMVFFECPLGGAVFSTGSIAYAGALAHNGYDNDIYRITTNVLSRFVDPEPFLVPREYVG